MDYDAHHPPRLDEIPLATVLRKEVQYRLAEPNQRIAVTGMPLGYKLRCAQPIPFDIDYTRTLGHGAVRFLLSGQHDGGIQDGNIKVPPREQLRDLETGRTRVRHMDIGSDYYEVVREHMIRLKMEDMEDLDLLAKLAEAVEMPLESFGTGSPPPARLK